MIRSLLATAALCAAATAQTTEFPPINPSQTGDRIPGKFVWADLVTDNTATTRKFYGGLFGWKFSGSPDHLVATNRGHPVAGVIQRNRPADRPDAKPLWFPYMSVPDVKASSRLVAARGGRILAKPTLFPGRGEQAVFADREGAMFGALYSASGDPADGMAREGDWIWLQLLSRDAPRAADFYARIGGYKSDRNSAENRSSDVILSSNGVARATIRTLKPDSRKVRPTWLPFVRVAKIQRSLDQVNKLGGSILVEPRSDLMNGRVAVVADPSGAAIGLMQWNPDQP